jgi:cytoskeletal protein RodZ
VRFFNLDRLRRIGDDVERGWPGYLFGGRIRTSTVVLIVAFAGLWWIYDAHQQAAKSSPTTTQVPATQVVPPGFVPDPNYTWVPRSRLQKPPPTVTVTKTPTTTPPTTTTPMPATTTTTPPFGLPPIVLPPPFGPPATTTSPAPGPAPAPPAAPAVP